jgi:ribosomal protein S6--L-glutamate ligase
MKLTILSGRPDLYSTKRLLEEATNAGFETDIIDYRSCSLGIGKESRVLCNKKDINPNVIIPRIGSKSSRFGAAVIRQFQVMGVPTTTQPGAILRARDKFATIQAFASAGLPVPSTSAARTPSSTDDVLSLVEGPPVVLKLLEGTHGTGVILAETKKAAESLIAAFYQLDADILLQQFIKEARGEDIRAFVVDGQVVAAMLRKAAPGEFRANLHQGGVASAITLSEEEKRIAVAAARSVGLDVAGVDMLRTENGPLLLEVNVSPGLQGIELASGVNVAMEIVSYAKKLLS